MRSQDLDAPALAENAVLLGVLSRGEGRPLGVAVRQEAKTLVMSVEDDGVVVRQVLANGVARKNSSDRLRALYGNGTSLTSGPGVEGVVVSVVFRIHYRHAAELRPLSAPESLSA